MTTRSVVARGRLFLMTVALVIATGVFGDLLSAQQSPSVTTTIPTEFSATGATLNGTVNPIGLETNASFDYGLTTAYGSSTPLQWVDAGAAQVPIGGGTVSGLTCDTVYHIRAKATNAAGTTFGTDQLFSPPGTRRAACGSRQTERSMTSASSRWVIIDPRRWIERQEATP